MVPPIGKLVLLFTILVICGQLPPVRSYFNVNQLIQDMNGGGGNAIDADEVEAFFVERWGPNMVTRCAFEERILYTYTHDVLQTSILFDVLKANPGTHLNRPQFLNAFLGPNRFVSTNVFNRTLETILSNVEDIMAAPDMHSDLPGLMPVQNYNADSWATLLDTDGDLELTKAEIYKGMHNLDKNDDSLVKRCEFVDAMKNFEQNPAVSAKVYDVLFKFRDLTWADTDSDFLIMMIKNELRSASSYDSPSETGSVTTQEFAAFFFYWNMKASALGSGSLSGQGLSGASGATGTFGDRSGPNALLLIHSLLVVVCAIYGKPTH